MKEGSGRLSWNLAAAGWSFDESGFLLADALIAILIVTVCVSLIFAAAKMQGSAESSLRDSIDAYEEQYGEAAMEIPTCIPCKSTPDATAAAS